MKPLSKRKEMMDRLIKDQVVKTVMKLIQEGHPITMDEVALQCGVSKGTLYNYFKNKKDLLNFVHEAVIQPVKNGSITIFDTSVPPMDRIVIFVDNVFNFHREYPLYFKFVLSQRSALDAVTERMSLTIMPLVDLYKEGIRAGQFVDTDPYVMAAMIFGTVVGPLESWDFRDTPVKNIETLKQDIIACLNRSILKQQEKPL